MERTSAAVAAVRACLWALLAGGDDVVDGDAGVSWTFPDSTSGTEFLAAARRHRVVPLLATALERLELPTELEQAVRSESESERFRCLRQATELARLFTVLHEAEMPALAFKGLALAEQAYGDFAARGVGDHDLLVRPADVARARVALADAGWVPEARYPTAEEGWTWRHLLRNGHEMELWGRASIVDLHWRLDPTSGALPGFDDLWRRRSTTSIAGTEVATLGAADALLHSCSNAAKDDWRWLRSLADVVRLTRLPGVWTGPDRPPLRPVQLRTLGIATAMLGSSDDLPSPVRQLAEQAGAPRLRFADQRQTAPLGRLVDRFPGVAFLDAVRRRSRGSRAPADLGRVLLAALAPPSELGGMTDGPALTIGLRVLRRRSDRLRDRLRAWQAAR